MRTTNSVWIMLKISNYNIEKQTELIMDYRNIIKINLR